MNTLFTHWEFANPMSSPWHTAGWTMCLFLVLGTAVAIAGALLRLLVNRAAPTIRYTTSLAVFAVLSTLPIGIAIWLSQTSPTATATNSTFQPTTPTAIDLKQPQIAPPSGWEPTPSNQIATNLDSPQPEAGAIYGLTLPHCTLGDLFDLAPHWY